MATDWFYKAGDYACGPFTDAQLSQLIIQRRIGRDTLVRKGTAGQWGVAGNQRDVAFADMNQGPLHSPNECPLEPARNRPDNTPPQLRDGPEPRPFQFSTPLPLLPPKSRKPSFISVWSPTLLILVAVAAGATMVWMKNPSAGPERKVADAAREKPAKRLRPANADEQIKKPEKPEANAAVAGAEPDKKREKPGVNADFNANVKPDRVAAKKAPIKVRHIHGAMEEAGFDLYRFDGGGVRISTQIADYIRYGSAAAAVKAARGYQDRLEAERNAEKHRDVISKDYFYLPNLAVSFAGESKTSGLYLLRCPVPNLRLYEGRRGLAPANLEHVDYRRAWYLTTEMQLRGPLSAQEMNFARANGGVIFNQESSETTLILMTDEQQAKRVSQNPNSFACHLVISNVSWSEPTQLRFYREDTVRLSDFNCAQIDRSADVGVSTDRVFDTPNDRHFSYAVAKLRQLTIQELGQKDAVYRESDADTFVIPADVAIPMNRNVAAGAPGNNAGEMRPKPQATKSLAVPAKRVLGNSPKSRIPEKAFTGLNVKKGQKVRMTAEGTIKVGHGINETAGPEALLIAIGESGKPAVQRIPGQAEVEFVVEHDGGVFIGVCNPSPEDNRGELNVKIEVFD